MSDVIKVKLLRDVVLENTDEEYDMYEQVIQSLDECDVVGFIETSSPDEEGNIHSDKYGLVFATGEYTLDINPVIVTNKIVSIGYLGGYECYLNVSVEEAILRYKKCRDVDVTDDMVEEMEFTDSFGAYEVYKTIQ